MWNRKRCGCRKNVCWPIGPVLIALGLGIFLAYIIPYYLLITLLGCALIVLGIRFLMKK